MFTGLIEELGTVVDLTLSGTSECLKIKAFGVFEGEGSNPGEGSQNLQNGLKIGDSIAVNGVCLTAVAVAPPYFEVTCVAETLAKTTLGSLTKDMRVNLERACTPTTRLGGHLVAGHVDGKAKVAQIREIDGSWEFFFELPEGAERYVIPMGSIAINGISLTVAEITREPAKGRGAVIKIAIIPHTYSQTTVQYLKTGDEVNIELDQIAKMVERQLEPRLR